MPGWVEMTILRGLGKLSRIGVRSKRESGEAVDRSLTNDALRQVSTGGLRNEVSLTAAERTEVFDYARSLGMPEERIRFSEYDYTAYGSTFDVLIIGTDVLPARTPPGLGSLAANSRISARGAIAHELVGHREAALAGRTHAIDDLEEAQASIRAARFAPALSDTERMTLLRGAVARLRRAGYRVRDVRGELYIEHR
jgi:hypothetical protein